MNGIAGRSPAMLDAAMLDAAMLDADSVGSSAWKAADLQQSEWTLQPGQFRDHDEPERRRSLVRQLLGESRGRRYRG